MENNKVTVVTLKTPCSACFMIEGLVKEILNKLKKEVPDLNIIYIVLDDLKHVHEIEGLEVEKFPAVIIKGEQVTAGSIPDKRELLKFLS